MLGMVTSMASVEGMVVGMVVMWILWIQALKMTVYCPLVDLETEVPVRKEKKGGHTGEITGFRSGFRSGFSSG